MPLLLQHEDSGASSHPRAYARGAPAGLDLIGSRKSHAKKVDGDKSRIDLVVEEMRDKGIKVIETLSLK